MSGPPQPSGFTATWYEFIPRLNNLCWEFAARWQPARQVAGDFYNFISLDGG